MAVDQRFIISARIIGAVHRDTPKLKMFMISVLWSDETEVIVYRSFKDFKKFHRQLKKRFPHLNPFRKNDRVIPKFTGQVRRNSLQKKGSKRSVQRMKFLESYCDKLLKCDQTVTQSSEVAQFFMPKDHDLQPDFTKNSIMILLPDGSGGGGGDVTRQHAGSITHPFVTQTYRCVAAYETKDTKNRPFKVAVDEKLDVLIKDPAGWWLVENEDKLLAWFPAPYLELCEGEDGDDAGFQLAGALYCAVRSYSTKKDDEVSVPIGSVVEVLRKSDNGWWLIRFNGKAGYIPSMNLQPYNNPRAGLYSLQKKLHSSTLNLATSREPQAPRPSGINEENSPQRDSAGQSRGEPSLPGRLHKARSLDVLSETWSQTPTEREASTSEGRARSLSNTSTEISFSDFSSSSESSSPTVSPSASPQPGVSDSGISIPDLSLYDRRGSNTSPDSSGSLSSKGSEMASVAPRMPPRPKTEEILTRCTTMTRKAALATKTRLQIQPESIHSR
ncbi:NADPH oxidase organizer 1-like [Anoplopoma fimbria]|uniref:NADPH oxidase organizer 1-like n=1 Tax=Anoplopoma fimbria TaxID=229290 RepID=UPI0023EAAB6A|nr:NADPH oxidase organizer 1-like [Anoplopoma fimbria]XP_054454748.1 NADPH oxidase organizer 1-like [Anoplopoma fimbria]XP_054454749.1 NADPH oxidase organizer 1-like [Anoplopoma fimbria]XP_054454750.1 NADPH oxidase organizer 1-like [Anoplopoma fimbria]